MANKDKPAQSKSEMSSGKIEGVPADPVEFPDVSTYPRRSGVAMAAAWVSSSTIRHAVTMHRHVQKLINHQRDILSPAALESLNTAQRDLDAAIRAKMPTAQLVAAMGAFEKTANKFLRPYPSASARENVEVLLVALAVAMAIRTFFLQPFKIPTGSMQPTLFGVVSSNLLVENPGFKIPTGMDRVRDWFAGISYLRVKAANDGKLQEIRPPLRIFIFSIKQDLVIGGRIQTIWFPPDYGGSTLEQRAGLRLGEDLTKGEEFIRLKIAAGDHLFVDRLTLNFRPPMRGEIIVFETRGIPAERREYSQIPGDQFYIKRLVGLGGERVQLGDDRHLIINGHRLDSSVPHFERIYSFDPNKPPAESQYSGHVNLPYLARYFEARPEGVTLREDELMVMGDNTLNSLDSRAWGPFPAKYVVGKAFFVYWPITDRFGWGYNR